MKLYYNTVSNDLVTIDASGETWTQGDVDSKTLEVYFGTVSGEVFTTNTSLVLTHECRIVVERPDGAVSPELYLTPQLDGSYKLVISGWIAGVEGNVKITPRLKLGSVVTAYGLALIPVAEGILPADSVITPEEYNLLLVAINDLAGRVTVNEGDIVALETFQAAMIAGTQAVRKIKYDTTNPATTFSIIGETRYSDTFKTIETRLSSSTILQHGLEVLAYVRNAEANTLVNGEVVYIVDETVGGSSQVLVKRASNDNDTAYSVLGVVTENTISANNSGFIVLIGEMTLSGYTAGQPLYLGVNGALTTTKPTAPARVVKMGTAAPNTRAFILPNVTPSLEILSDTNIDVTGMTKPVLTKVNNHWVAYDIAPYEANLAQALIDIGVAENDIDALEGRMDTAESTLTTKADKSTTIVGLNLSANITKSQLLEAVGNATTLAAGFMSATDKSYLDELYALLDTDDADALVNTLGEILQLFNNYPEGADIVTALAGKANVVHTHVEADITDLDKYTQAEADALLLTKVDKETGKSLVADTEITKLVALDSQSELDNKLALKIDKDLSNNTTYPPKTTLVGADRIYIDDNGVAKKTTMTDIATFVGGETGTFVPSGDYQGDGLGAYESAVLDVHDVSLQTNGDFRCSIKAIETDKLLYVQFPTITATNALRLSTDNGATYYNVLKNGATLRANIVSGQLVSMYFNGTNFIADIQGDVEIVERYASKINSTFGQFNPHDNGVPLVKEVLGRTIPALSNLVTNGDFSNGTTGWLSHATTFYEISNVSNQLSVKILNNTQTISNAMIKQEGRTIVSGNVYYIKAHVKPLYSGQLRVQIGGNSNNYYNITANIWNDVKGGIITSSTDGVLYFFTNVNLYTVNESILFDNIQLFNLTASHGVTATSGTAYDNAVADIEAMLALNGGYITSTPTTHVENSQFKSVGKNLFDGVFEVGTISSTTGQNATGATSRRSVNYISVLSNTAYVLKHFNAQRGFSYNWYDSNYNFISQSAFGSPESWSQTSPVNAKYLRITIPTVTVTDFIVQLEQGTVATTYAPYNTETQTFNHGALRRLPNNVSDKIRYNNGAYVLDRYVQEYTLLSADIVGLVTSATNFDFVNINKPTNAIFYGNTTYTGVFENAIRQVGAIGTNSYADNANRIYYLMPSNNTLYAYAVPKGTYANLAAAQAALAGTKIWYQLSTPLLAQSVIDVDGTLIQESVTTLEQLQNIPTTYDIEYSMNTEQSVKTLVQRDKLQQQEIDSNEARLGILEPKVSTLESEMDTVQTNLSTAEDDIDSLESNAEMKANKVTAFSTPTDIEYPSAKLVKDSLDLKTTDSTLATVAKTGAYADLTGKPAYSLTLLGSRTNAGTISVSNWSTYDDIRMVVEYVNTGESPTMNYRATAQNLRSQIVYHPTNPNSSLACMLANATGTAFIGNINLYINDGSTSVTIEKQTITGTVPSLNIYVYGIKYLGV